MSRDRDYIPAEKLTAYERWEIPALGEAAQARKKVRTAEAAPNRPPTVEELESIRHLAHEEGFRQGKEDGYRAGLEQGLKEGQTEIIAQVAKLASIMRAYTQPLAQQQAALEQSLVSLVENLARTVVLRELETNPDTLLKIVREALAAVARQGERLTVQLNPADLAMIRENVSDSGEWDPAWRFMENPALTPGGCIVETALNYVDATVESRLKEMLTAFSERVQDDAHE